MRRTLTALACTLALAGAAVAQQQDTQPPRQNTPEPQGGGFIDRVKNAFKSLGTTAKDKAAAAKEGASDKMQTGESKDTKSMGAPGSLPQQQPQQK